MRTLTLEIEPFETVKEEMAETFAHVRSYSILETLKMDYQEGICIEILEFTLKEGASIHDIRTVGNMEILSVLKSIDNKHTCLIRYTEPEETKEAVPGIRPGSGPHNTHDHLTGEIHHQHDGRAEEPVGFC